MPNFVPGTWRHDFICVDCKITSLYNSACPKCGTVFGLHVFRNIFKEQQHFFGLFTRHIKVGVEFKNPNLNKEHTNENTN